MTNAYMYYTYNVTSPTHNSPDIEEFILEHFIARTLDGEEYAALIHATPSKLHTMAWDPIEGNVGEMIADPSCWQDMPEEILSKGAGPFTLDELLLRVHPDVADGLRDREAPKALAEPMYFMPSIYKNTIYKTTNCIVWTKTHSSGYTHEYVGDPELWAQLGLNPNYWHTRDQMVAKLDAHVVSETARLAEENRLVKQAL